MAACNGKELIGIKGDLKIQSFLDLLCYWAVVDLGISMVDVARKLDITPAAVSYSVQRGEKMVKEEDHQLELLKL